MFRESVKWGSKEHDKIIDACQERFDFSEQARKTRDDMARRAYKHFRSHLAVAKNWIFSTRIYEPHWKSMVDTHVARETAAVFSADPFLRYVARGRTDWRTAELCTSGVKFHLDQRRPRMPVRDLLWQRRMYSTAYAGVSWRYETRDVGNWRRGVVEAKDPMTGMPILNPATGEPIYLEQWTMDQDEKVLVDSPWFDAWHWSECYPDVSETTVEEGDWFIRRFACDERYVKMKLRHGEKDLHDGWDPKITRRLLDKDDSASSVPLDDIHRTFEWQADIGFDARVDLAQITGKKQFEVLEVRQDKWMTVIVNRAYVVSRKKNIFGDKMVLHIKNYPLAGDHFGMSDFEVVEKLITGLNDMRNAGATEALLSVFTPIIAPPGTEQNEFRYEPKAIWRASNPELVSYLQRPTNGIEISQVMMESFRNSIDNAAATSDAYRGALGSPDQKATALQLAVEAAGLRLQDQIDSFSDQFTVPLGQKYLMLMRVLEDVDRLVRITEDPAAPMAVIPSEAWRDVELDVVATAASSTMRALEEKRLLEYYQTVVGAQEPAADRRALFEAVSTVMVPKWKDRVVKSEEQMAMEQQQAMMLAMGGQGLSPGGALGTFPTPTGGPGVDRSQRGPTENPSRMLANQLSQATTL